MDLKAIKKRLRELRADPSQSGATAEAQRLRGELARAVQTRDVRGTQGSADRRSRPGHERNVEAPMDASTGPRRLDDNLAGDVTAGLSEADREAIKTWPSSLRAALGRSSLNQVISGPVDDPNRYGAKNDLKRWSPWR